MPHSPTNRPRLSIVLIVRDAEELIVTTLRSISSIADEIVVADTGSSDQTVDRAKAHSVKVIQVPWIDSFSAARNQCFTHVQGDWLLWLDAGEHFVDDAAQQLRSFIDQGADPSRAYMMLISVPRSRETIAGEQVAQVRLVPNNPSIRFHGRIRETLFDSVQSLGLSVEGLPWRIHRPPSDNDPQLKISKARRNLRLAELEMSELGPGPRLLNCKGDALQILQDSEGAQRCFSQSIAASKPGSAEMLEAYYGLLTALDGIDETREKQLTTCLQGLEAFPLDAQLLCAMGGYLQSQGRLDLACRAYQTAYQHGQVDPQTWHLKDINQIAAVCYSLALQLQNNDKMAQKSLEEALDANRKSERIRRHLIELYVKQGHRDKALKLVDQRPLPVAQRESLRSGIRGACLASQNNWPAAKAYLQAAFRAGCRDPICLRWYAVTLVAVGDNSNAKMVLNEWAKVDPANAEVQRLLQTPLNQMPKDSVPDRSVRIDPQQQPRVEHSALSRTIANQAAGSVPDPPAHVQ